MRRVLAVFFLAAAPIISQADELGNQFFSRDELRVIRKHATSLVAAEAARAVQAQPSWSLELGAAVDHGQGGDRSWSTPFDLNVTSADRKTAFDLEGDGYTRERSAGASASGLADVTIAGSHDFAMGSDSTARFGAAFVIPTHGEVGSSAPSERVVGAFAHQVGVWTASVQGSVTHRGDVDSGSHFGKAALAQISWDLSGPIRDVAAQFVRSWRAGGSGASAAAIAVDFRMTSALEGSFSLSRGLTNGARDTSAEFDVTCQF